MKVAFSLIRLKTKFNIMMQRTETKMLPGYVGSAKDLISQKLKKNSKQ